MIRMRLLVGFVLVALLPLVGVSIATYLVNYTNGRQQAIERLESVAARKELAILGWSQSLQQELLSVYQADTSPRFFSNSLRLANEGTTYAWYFNLVRKRLTGFVNQSPQFDELFLLDLNGRVVISTNPIREGAAYRELPSFKQGLGGPVTRLPFRQPAESLEIDTLPDDPQAVFGAIPIHDVSGQLLGVIIGRGSPDRLLEILTEGAGLGQTGKAYLVNDLGYLLVGTHLFEIADLDPDFSVETGGIYKAIQSTTGDAGLYKDPQGVNVIGIYRWLPSLQTVLTVEQDTAEAFRTVSTNLTINLVIAFSAIIIAVLASLMLTRTIANPIINLAGTAARISKGNFDLAVGADRTDEVGVLARAFNSMTRQLSDLINSLEKRVTDRTLALQKANDALEERALQMQTSAQVGREITSILNLDVLLARVVELIQDAFGYYNVQIFLLEKDTGQLVLRANSGGGSAQHHHISLQQTSINSQAAQGGQAVMVNDVATSPSFLFDSQLPDTRSELVIPLRLGDQVIGTLDVHASQINAFTEEDIIVIQSLGDQIVVAIENAHLYDQSRVIAVLEERTRLARELHDSVTQSLYSLVLLTEGWRRRLSVDGNALTEDYLSKIGEIARQSLLEMRMLLHELRPPTLQQEGLVSAIRRRLDVVENRVGIEARVIMEDFIELPAYVEDGLYWIALEALNNAMKHSGATRETVRICVSCETVVLEVIDNGRGFEVETGELSGGMGLANMRERARQMGGSFSIWSDPGEGTSIKAMVPILWQFNRVAV